MVRGTLSQAACGLAFLFCASAAFAGSFVVSPVRVTLSDTKRVVSLTVRNSGSSPSVIQIDTMSWSQTDGKDLYSATREILATPPIFTVPPGGSQIVRIGLRRAADPSRELTYRLFFQEVPPPQKPGFQGLNVALRIGIPVFVFPKDGASPQLDWRAYRNAAGQLTLSLANSGNAHVQVASFSVKQPGGKGSDIYQIGTYVLPGKTRDWLIKGNLPAGARLALSAKTDAGDVRSDVLVEAR